MSVEIDIDIDLMDLNVMISENNKLTNKAFE